jgi:hypothetical protein
MSKIGLEIINNKLLFGISKMCLFSSGMVGESRSFPIQLDCVLHLCNAVSGLFDN